MDTTLMNAGCQFELSSSRRARQVCRLAAALTAMAAAACVVAVVLSPSVSRAAVALLATFAALFVANRSAGSWTGTLTVDTDGAVRIDSDRGNQSVVVEYCGPKFICLRSTRGALAVWPDALRAIDWRRLLVACRWPRGPSRVADGKSRTK